MDEEGTAHRDRPGEPLTDRIDPNERLRLAFKGPWIDPPGDNEKVNQMFRDMAWEAARERGTPVNGYGYSIHDESLYPPTPPPRAPRSTERKLRPAVLQFFRHQGWNIFWDPDGSDWIDVLLVRGNDVMCLELKDVAWSKAIDQAVARAHRWFDYSGVVMPMKQACRVFSRIATTADWEAHPVLKYVAPHDVQEENANSVRGRIGVYGVVDGKIEILREPARLDVDPEDVRHVRTLRWAKLYEKDKRFARQVAYTYLLNGNFKTTHGIKLNYIDRMAEGLPPTDDPVDTGQRSMDEFQT